MSWEDLLFRRVPMFNILFNRQYWHWNLYLGVSFWPERRTLLRLWRRSRRGGMECLRPGRRRAWARQMSCLNVRRRVDQKGKCTDCHASRLSCVTRALFTEKICPLPLLMARVHDWRFTRFWFRTYTGPKSQGLGGQRSGWLHAIRWHRLDKTHRDTYIHQQIWHITDYLL